MYHIYIYYNGVTILDCDIVDSELERIVWKLTNENGGVVFQRLSNNVVRANFRIEKM